MTLSKQQIASYHEDGYLLIKNALLPDQLGELQNG